MKDFQGIRQDTDWTADDGAFYAANPSYDTAGELQRRPGMALFSPQSGNVMWAFWSPRSAYQMVYATNAGELVVVGVS